MFIDEYEENDSNRRMPEDHEIEKVIADDDSIAYGLYSQLIAYEDHYNVIQNKFKGLTITWTLATFIGIGYLISGFEKALYIDVLLVVFLLSILSAQGVFLIWFLDSEIYDNLIYSIWKEIYKLEEDHSFLGKSHHLVSKFFKGEKKAKVFHGVFYAYFIFILLIVGIISLSLYLFYISSWMIALSIPLVFIVIYFISKKSKESLHSSDKTQNQ